MMIPRSLEILARVISLILTLGSLVACTPRSERFLRPNGVAVAPDGSLYVMDRGNYRVAHVAPDGEFIASFGYLGTDAPAIHTGWDIARDSRGNIYICNQVYDENNARLIRDGVKVFAPDGSFVREIGRQEYPLSTNTPPNKVIGLDIDDQDRIYVADSSANTVRVFTPGGTLIARFFGEKGGVAGQFNSIVDVAIDDQRQFMYVTDSINSRVQQFRLREISAVVLAAEYQQSFGTYGQQRGQLAYPRNLAVDEAQGHVYVGDMANRRIQVFDAEGSFVRAFTPPILTDNLLRGGVGPWQVLGLTLDSEGALYATDALNNKIWVFELDGSLRSEIEVSE